MTPRDTASTRSDPTPAPSGSDHRDAARKAVAPTSKEQPDASVLETLGSAVTQPVRDAATAKSDKQIKKTRGGREADEASTDGQSKEKPTRRDR